MGRGYISRREGLKKPRRKVLIFCEGKETEINYFTGLRTRNSGVEIIPIHGGTYPMHIVKFAAEKMKKRSIDFDEGDGVWCVFDVDENKNQILKDSYDQAKTEKIQITLSNPCFELWFLLHYKEILSPLSRQEARRKLKTYIPDYEKNKKINHLLQDRLTTAITRAEKLNKLHERQKRDLISRESNPSSQVFRLINFIQKLVEINR